MTFAMERKRFAGLVEVETEPSPVRGLDDADGALARLEWTSLPFHVGVRDHFSASALQSIDRGFPFAIERALKNDERRIFRLPDLDGTPGHARAAQVEVVH